MCKHKNKVERERERDRERGGANTKANKIGGEREREEEQIPRHTKLGERERVLTGRRKNSIFPPLNKVCQPVGGKIQFESN